MISQLCEVFRTALLILQATIAFTVGTLDETFSKKKNDREATAPRSYRRAFQDWGNISMSDKYYIFSLILGHLFGSLLGRPKQPIDDRRVPFEKLMQFLADLPNDRVSNRIVAKTTSTYIKKFWDDLERPPRAYFGQNWRRGDGSFNSMIYPSMGKAGSAYAMTVQRSRISQDLPSPAQLFDRLMSRDNVVGNKKFEPHPSGLNAFFFYLATLITHDLFHSDPRDPLRNLTTSYADLAPLYGASKEDQDKIRKHENGLLLPDTWSDSFRLLFQPPGISALLIIFSRNHNRIAKMVLEINENGFLNNLTQTELDETLFQLSRNINCACYANLILNDYVRSILGLQPGQDPVLNPLMTPPSQDSKSGNAVSLEFNFVYRWHSAISEADAEWSDKLFNSSSAFHDYGKFKRNLQIGLGQMELARATGDPTAASRRDEIVGHVVKEIGKVFDFEITEEETKSGRPHVIGYRRNKETGLFPDKDVISMIKTAMRSRAGRLGANHVPASLKPVEMAGIEQARKAGLATLNEFRAYFQLKKYEKFDEINSNPQVARALSQLYKSVDDVELYPGLVIEQTKRSGVSLPYTISRAILADAVNLLRNDRFYTDELTRFKLTNAGFDLASGASGRYHTAFPNMLHDLFPGAFDTSDLNNIFMMPDFTDNR